MATPAGRTASTSHHTCKSARRFFQRQLTQKSYTHELHTLFVQVRKIGALRRIHEDQWVRDVVVSDYTNVREVLEEQGYPHAHLEPHDFTMSMDGRLAETFRQLVGEGEVVKICAVALRPIMGVGVIVLAQHDFPGQRVQTGLNDKAGAKWDILQRKQQWENNRIQMPTPTESSSTSGSSSSAKVKDENEKNTQVATTPIKPMPIPGSASRDSFYQSDEDDFLEPPAAKPEDLVVVSDDEESEVTAPSMRKTPKRERDDSDDDNEEFGLNDSNTPAIKRAKQGHATLLPSLMGR